MDGHRIFTFCDCMFHCNFHSTLPFRGRAVVTYNSHSLFEKVRFSCWTHSWCFHSLLLSPSWLFSFPPLNNMLKFSGWSWWRDGLFGFFIFCLWWNWSSSFVCFSWEESNNVQAAFLFSQVILFPPFLSFPFVFRFIFRFLSFQKQNELNLNKPWNKNTNEKQRIKIMEMEPSSSSSSKTRSLLLFGFSPLSPSYSPSFLSSHFWRWQTNGSNNTSLHSNTTTDVSRKHTFHPFSYIITFFIVKGSKISMIDIRIQL